VILLSSTGPCTNCAHCGRSLRDHVSVEVGVGPVCRRDYDVEPSPADIEGARSALAEYPEALVLLIDIVGDAVLPRRRVVDGLTRLMSLNREDVKFFAAACDAIVCLGFVMIAAILRSHIAGWEIYQPPNDENTYLESTRLAVWPWSMRAKFQRDGLGSGSSSSGRMHIVVPTRDRSTLLRVFEILAEHCGRQPITLPDGKAWIAGEMLSALGRGDSLMKDGPRRPRFWRLRRRQVVLPIPKSAVMASTSMENGGTP